ncbi:MAG: helix-turn-helix domain-containing protein [Caldilineaceae bacterium]
MQSTAFGQWIKRLRAEQDLTQETLSEAIGCSSTYLRYIEIGKRRPSRAMVERIADVLNLPTEQRAEFLRLARLPLGESDEEEAQPVIAPPPLSPPAIVLPSTLLLSPHGLIGRAAELAALQTLLLEEGCRLITVVSAGGMGKTALAIACANRLAPHFAEGTVIVALAALEDARHLPTAIASALSISLQGSLNPAEQVITALATRQLLLVLDNFEHLLVSDDAINWLKALLERAPTLQILITSRERLRIRQERVFALDGLTVTDSATHKSDAIELFIERAQAVSSEFVASDENRSAIRQICQLLNGMPLGIELAAAWVRVLECPEIAEELQRNIDFLTLSDRDMSPRHRSMRAVFDHSWQLLNEDERRVLAGLSIFRGGCSRMAAQQVVGTSLSVLASLIDKSLLRRNAEVEGQARYELHELLRQYAGQQLTERSTFQQAVQERMIDFYARFVCEEAQLLRGDRQMSALAQFEKEIDNIRTAWGLACARLRADALLQMLEGVGDTFYWWSRYQEAIALLRSAIAGIEHTVQTLPIRDQSNLPLRAALCGCRIWLAVFEVKNIEATFTNLQQQLDQLRTEGWDTRTWQAHLLRERAFYQAVYPSNYALASQFEAASVTLYRQLDNPQNLIRALARQARIAHLAGRYHESIILAQEAIALAQRQGDQLASIGALEGLAISLTYLGRFTEAETHFVAALAATEATHQLSSMASVLNNLGVLRIFAGQFEQSRVAWQHSIAICRTIGDPNRALHASILTGFAALHLGEYATAAAIAQSEQLRAQTLSIQRLEAMSKLLLASVQLVKGQGDAALRSLTQSVALYRATTHHDELGWALATQALVLRSMGDHSDMRQSLRESLSMVQQTHAFLLLHSLLPVVALDLIDQGETEQAIGLIALLNQSGFVRHSHWFQEVALAEIEQFILTLPSTTQPFLYAQHPTGDPPDVRKVLLRINFSA